MNCDHSLSFLDRWDLKISDQACKKEFLRVQYQINPFTLIKKTGCNLQTCLKHKSLVASASKSTPATMKDSQDDCEVLREHCGHMCENLLCADGLLFDTIQCQQCKQPPVFAKQCPLCSKLSCQDCQNLSPSCISCTHSTKQTVGLVEIKDQILKDLLDKLIRYKHKCSDKGEVKIYS